MRYVSLYLVSAIIAVFIFQQADPSITDSLKLESADVWERPWMLVTHIFVHSGILHLLYNAFGLALFGTILEKKIGSKQFLILFFASGIAAGIASAFFYPASLGASGAVFGIIGALAVLMPMMVVWVSYLPMPMFAAAAFWAAGDLMGFIIPSNVANAAHLAGLAFGLIAGFVLRGRKPLFPKKAKKQPALTKAEIEQWENEYMAKR